MNIRKLIATVITGVSLLGFAGISLAANGAVPPASDINIYGSSAQFNFWKATGATYLTDAGCLNVKTVTAPCDSNQVIVSSSNCNSIRITSKASWDGILAVAGNTTNPNLKSEATPQTETCTGIGNKTATPSSPAVYCTGYTRPMCADATCLATACETVTGGATDVAAGDITQLSSGQLNGPLNGGAITRNFTGAGALATSNGSLLDTATQKPLVDCQEVVVPFGFWVSSDLTGSVTNLNQVDVRMIFSGQIQNWSDLGITVPAASNPINVCWRHAGSGTSATLQLTQMTPAELYANGEVVNGAGQFNYYFNDGTGNEQDCVNTLTGAVGYWDADKTYGAGVSHAANVIPVTFNGITTSGVGQGPALKAMIEAGQYDFWTVENLFEQLNNNDMANLCSYLQNAGNNGIAMPDAWYAYTCQLDFTKSGNSSYMGYSGHTCPQ